ncbi:hypothetical protein AURDEDRAFT_172877 [Auricularia subglabra TFB-10046 SS5]|uniref:Uncharacterized protein n=1 Tax=Auricularia subglabra (strain TFB-10046 / SS5) TaxID=717982 RepID=J0WVH8_AURST|nr:hypothetical protein AURDEDRAFT_172877 [Auricularia subglabra TFB-10046 SS5]
MWVFIAAFELVIFVMTAIKGFGHFHEQHSSLISSIYRDSLLYFVFIFGISAANVMVSYMNPGYDLLLGPMQCTLHSKSDDNKEVTTAAYNRRIYARSSSVARSRPVTPSRARAESSAGCATRYSCRMVSYRGLVSRRAGLQLAHAPPQADAIRLAQPDAWGPPAMERASKCAVPPERGFARHALAFVITFGAETRFVPGNLGGQKRNLDRESVLWPLYNRQTARTF